MIYLPLIVSIFLRTKPRLCCQHSRQVDITALGPHSMLGMHFASCGSVQSACKALSTLCHALSYHSMTRRPYAAEGMPFSTNYVMRGRNAGRPVLLQLFRITPVKETPA